MAHVVQAYKDVLSRVAAAYGRAVAAHPGIAAHRLPRLVAVSKTKPVQDVLAVHGAGCRDFGENYVQELIEKSAQFEAAAAAAGQDGRDIAWRFIGQLQSNKARQLVTSVPALHTVESVDSVKLANLLEKGVVEAARAPLHVYVQVNTSGEEQKGGVAPGDAPALAMHIMKECPHLKLAGLMTLGKLGEGASIYFERLVEERRRVADALGLPLHELELSMGMSADFEDAIACGSTSVRVGSSIFGERNYGGAAASGASAAAAAAAPVSAAGGAASGVSSSS